ncbi:MAG: acylneuraminate cytidylyltransferase family protein, partial [Dehalococcoidia bacterium]|nr:acylneuraminate cytidylyltransferase family protein [Dehalococcoidia bacterium]
PDPSVGLLEDGRSDSTMTGSICVIPAKGDSSRVPGKNLRPLEGRPLVAWPIVAALESGLFDLGVWVNSDSDEVSEVGMKYGASPWAREKEVRREDAQVAEVVSFMLGQDDFFKDVRTVCIMTASAPFTSVDDLRWAARWFAAPMLLDGCQDGCPSPMSVNVLHAVRRLEHPIERTFRMREGGLLLPHDPRHITTPTQDLPPAYRITGNFHFLKASHLAEMGPTAFLGPAAYGFEVKEKWRAHDVDTEEDWQEAAVIAAFRGKDARIP